MSIFKRDQDPPYNRAAATRPATAPVTSAVPYREPPPVPPPAPPEHAGSEPATASITPPVAREAAAVIDRKSEITGTLHSSGNVLIEGRFHGEVEANETVWVETGAQSDGQLRAAAAVISGTVDGKVDCGTRLQIASSAVVTGEIKTPILVIEDGATVNCRFSMARPRMAAGGIR